MTINLRALERLAKAATPGGYVFELAERDSSWPGLWQAVVSGPFTFGYDGEEGVYLNNPSDAKYITAVSPDTVLALISALREADYTTNFSGHGITDEPDEK